MQRIKLELFKTFFEKNLTGNEIDFLIALTYVQDNRGVARGVFYRDMMAMSDVLPNVDLSTYYDERVMASLGGAHSRGIGQDD